MIAITKFQISEDENEMTSRDINLIIRPADGCVGCYFENGCDGLDADTMCVSGFRRDNTNIIWIEKAKPEIKLTESITKPHLHKHHDMIVAWLSGETVQYRVSEDAWADLNKCSHGADVPQFFTHKEYRIRPKECAYQCSRIYKSNGGKHRIQTIIVQADDAVSAKRKADNIAFHGGAAISSWHIENMD